MKTSVSKCNYFLSDGDQALDYLTAATIEPFIIFSPINMPRLDGIELRAKVDENEDLRMKSIPYLFFITVAEQQHSSILLMPAQNQSGIFLSSDLIFIKCRR